MKIIAIVGIALLVLTVIFNVLLAVGFYRVNESLAQLHLDFF